MKTDVIIIGKGIAGLVLSWLLDKQDIEHVLLCREGERKAPVFGETLPPSAIPLLQSLGLKELFEQLAFGKTNGYHSIWGNDRVTDHNFHHDQSSPYGLKINKAAILQSLENSQVKRIKYFDHLKQIKQKSDHSIECQIELAKKVQHVSSKLIVDATGRNRVVLKHFKIPNHKYDQLNAFSCHLPSIVYEQLPYKVLVESFANGWGIVSNLNREKNVMTLFTLAGNNTQKNFTQFDDWHQILSQTEGLKYFLKTNVKPKILGSDASSSIPYTVADSNWIAVGDAAMAFDPLSSHGITNTLYTTQRASKVIKETITKNNNDSMNAYNRSIHQIFEGYLSGRNQLYQQETRWVENDFWRRMHLASQELNQI